MNAEEIHRNAIVVDGLVISKWSREVFEDMHSGGITAVNCTCSVWEGLHDTLVNVAQWKSWFSEHADILLPVHTTTDIEKAKRENRVGIILGWQNTSGIEDRLELIAVFKSLGVGVMQLTYNTQNLVGSGCYESHDSGLSDYGRGLIDEMNRVGVVVDLSHVGAKTSEDAIRYSKVPVAYSHCCPAALLDHPRNKTDAQLKLIIEHGGFVGVTTYPSFLPRGAESTVDDCVAAIEYVVDLVGEDRVGIGTDFTQGQDAAFFDWLSLDKGHGRRLIFRDWAVAPQPVGLQRLSEFSNLTAAMVRRGWSETRILKVLGENWVSFLREVWGE
jgi:membrane dipeptidase